MNFVESLAIKVHCTTIIKEAQLLPPNYSNGLNKLREELPQFKDITDIDSFTDFCKGTGTRVCKKSFKAYELNPSQSHIDSDKVISIVQDYTQSSPPIIQPIVIDKDGYIIDGHHRWTALMYMNPNIEIPCYQFNVKVKHLLGNKVPRWQDTIGNDKHLIEGFSDLDGDVTDPKEMFDGIKQGVINAIQKNAKLFVVKKSDRLLSVLDRNGNNFIFLRIVSKGVSLEVYFPKKSVPEVKIFNHWNKEYNLRIFKNLLDVIEHLKEYWEEPQMADSNRADIERIKNQYRTQMSKF